MSEKAGPSDFKKTSFAPGVVSSSAKSDKTNSEARDPAPESLTEKEPEGEQPETKSENKLPTYKELDKMVICNPNLYHRDDRGYLEGYFRTKVDPFQYQVEKFHDGE